MKNFKNIFVCLLAVASVQVASEDTPRSPVKSPSFLKRLGSAAGVLAPVTWQEEMVAFFPMIDQRNIKSFVTPDGKLVITGDFKYDVTPEHALIVSSKGENSWKFSIIVNQKEGRISVPVYDVTVVFPNSKIFENRIGFRSAGLTHEYKNEIDGHGRVESFMRYLDPRKGYDKEI